jgi:hypothetical protein
MEEEVLGEGRDNGSKNRVLVVHPKWNSLVLWNGVGERNGILPPRNLII